MSMGSVCWVTAHLSSMWTESLNIVVQPSLKQQVICAANLLHSLQLGQWWLIFLSILCHCLLVLQKVRDLLGDPDLELLGKPTHYSLHLFPENEIEVVHREDVFVIVECLSSARAPKPIKGRPGTANDLHVSSHDHNLFKQKGVLNKFVHGDATQKSFSEHNSSTKMLRRSCSFSKDRGRWWSRWAWTWWYLVLKGCFHMSCLNRQARLTCACFSGSGCRGVFPCNTTPKLSHHKLESL